MRLKIKLVYHRFLVKLNFKNLIWFFNLIWYLNDFYKTFFQQKMFCYTKFKCGSKSSEKKVIFARNSRLFCCRRLLQKLLIAAKGV